MLDLRAAHAALKRDDFPLAWKLGNQALTDNPDSPEALFIVGATLRAMGNLGLSLTALSKAIARERNQPNLWMVYAATLHDLNRWQDAEKAFMHVHGMLPDDPMPPANIGATYVQRGMWRDAITWCDKALKIEPDNHIARISKGFACLSLGRWSEAWKYSDALYGNHIMVRVYNTPDKEESQWDGSPGKTVVVQCDQGVGDIIMFSQCIKRMQRDCEHVIIECAERMVGMFKRCFPGTEVHGTLKQDSIEWMEGREVDASIHVSSLGKFYLSKDSDFERVPYITPDPKLLDKWTTWLSQFPKPWRGIAWRGGIQATQTHLRSMEVSEFAPIIERPGTVIDLSYHDSSREVAQWNIDHEQQIIRPPINTKNYDDTIALIAALDDVCTVTTTVAHVCGSLGRKASVLVPAVAQWRYAYMVNGGTEMLWYPPDSVRLFRQRPGEIGWSSAIKRLVQA